jgi:glycosyltransferase involved in cell wall biosynthesis
MKITYFNRNLQCGYSIAKVFTTITDQISPQENIEQFYVPDHRAGLKSIIKNIYYVFKHRNTIGINHITGDIHYCLIALIGCKTVLTVHDLSAFDGQKNWLKKAITKFIWFQLPLLIADKVVCISAHTKSELLKFSKRKDIEVIYNAVDTAFFIEEPHVFRTAVPVILHIGTAWNKNLKNTVQAALSIPCHLCIVGKVEDSMILFLKESKISYSIKVGLTDLKLLDEYKNCDIVSFCSLYEGFGMPIIEANAIGRCVITSNLPPMDEIANDAACFVDPLDISSIEAAFKKIITDTDYRNNLIRKGKINIERFKVEKTVALYKEVYAQFS